MPVSPAPLLRIPYTTPFPAPRIIPPTANTLDGAVTALVEFLTAPPPRYLKQGLATPAAAAASSSASPYQSQPTPSHVLPSPPFRAPSQANATPNTILLTGAGLSTASGLSDYRGAQGTYTLNRQYRPVFFHEFCQSHESRQRYWARSFIGWGNMDRARPNAAHVAVGRLGELGVVGGVVTQNVDSLHLLASPHLPQTELHGALRNTICLTCSTLYPRTSLQHDLARLNPAWHALLLSLQKSGALETEDPEERRKRGLRLNPDGDVDIKSMGDAGIKDGYRGFRYPACPTCLARGEVKVHVDADGVALPPHEVALTSAPGRVAHEPSNPNPRSNKATSEGLKATGILKPNVTLFGESLSPSVRASANALIDSASGLLILGSSLATYSAWRLVKMATERGCRIGVVNIGGVRGEEGFFKDCDGWGRKGSLMGRGRDGEVAGVRIQGDVGEVLGGVVGFLEGR